MNYLNTKRAKHESSDLLMERISFYFNCDNKKADISATSAAVSLILILSHLDDVFFLFIF